MSLLLTGVMLPEGGKKKLRVEQYLVIMRGKVNLWAKHIANLFLKQCKSRRGYKNSAARLP